MAKKEIKSFAKISKKKISEIQKLYEYTAISTSENWFFPSSLNIDKNSTIILLALNKMKEEKETMTTKELYARLKADIEDTIKPIKEDIMSIKHDASELKSDVAEVKSEVAQLKTNVAEVKSDVTVLKSDVAELKSDVAELKADVAILKTDVSDLKEDVRVLKREATKHGWDLTSDESGTTN